MSGPKENSTKEETYLPTVSLEASRLSCAINAKD